MNQNTSTENYTNQPEKGPLKLSLFGMLKAEYGDSLQVSKLSKTTLVEISHALEKTVLDNRLPGIIFTGFQESSYWHKEIQRYQELANLVEYVSIFFNDTETTTGQNGDKATGEDAFNMVRVNLADDDFLRQEWFLIVVTTEFSMLLCGLDRLEPVQREGDRLFDTVLTFEPKLIEHSLDLIEGVLAQYRPEKLEFIRAGRQAFPPTLPSPHYLTLLMNLFIEQAGNYRQLRQELDQEQAMQATIRRLLHDASQPVTVQLAMLDLASQLGELLPEDLEVLVETSHRLKRILDQLGTVTRFQIERVGGMEFLDTGRPLFDSSSSKLSNN